MLSRYSIPFAAALVVAASATAADLPVYFDQGQYTATLDQAAQRWHLTPFQGAEVDIVGRTEDCGGQTHVPQGVWLVSRDAAGRLELVAPSATALPHDFPDRLGLEACGGTAQGAALQVPEVVLEWLARNVSSVMIDD
ncbi:MAG TPA: hypothetical protein VFB32_15225 [Rudaea sp.]|nr:hypothetical protein [Rudaea sp.]